MAECAGGKRKEKCAYRKGVKCEYHYLCAWQIGKLDKIIRRG
jgi:hypothetical protein